MTEIADMLGVSRARAKQLVHRPDFPSPFQRLTGMVIWDRALVEVWAREHRPPRTDDLP